MPASSRAWSTTSCTTRRATCSRSATTSPSAGATRATTTCSPRKRALRSFVAIAQGTAAAGELVRARPPAHERRRRAGAAVVERLDVRVPDAAAGDADLREHAARPDLPRGGAAADRVRPRSAACRGACPSPATTRSTPHSTTSTAPSACPASGLKRGLAEDLVVAPYASALALMVAPEAACANLQRLAAEGLGRAASASTRRSTTRRRACRAAQIERQWCARSWRTTRA